MNLAWKALLAAGATLTALLPTPAAHTRSCAEATTPCHGELRVPLDWSNPGAEKISVAYLWIPRGDRSRPPLTTAIANGGGPGPLDPSYAGLAKTLLGPLSDRVDILMVEPRGFGESSPLSCRGLDITRPNTIEACAHQIGDRGGFFTSGQAAADLDAVRAALGVRDVTFVGSSYGTLLGQAYATRFPKHLRAMFLESVIGTGEDGYAEQGFRNQQKLGLKALRNACRRSPACARHNPDPAALWDELLKRLRAQPDPKLPIGQTGHLLTAAANPDARSTLAAANAYLKDDPAPLRRLMNRATPPPPDRSPAPALFTYYCGDTRFPFDRDAPTAERLRQLNAYARRHHLYAPYRPSEVTGPVADWTRQCAHWPTPRQSPPATGNRPNVPVLAISGQFDSDTSPLDATSVAARHPRGHAYTVPFGGHGQLFGSNPLGACLQGVLRSFIADPTKPAHPDCTAENYRLLGDFPTQARELAMPYGHELSDRQRRTVAAAFATAADAIAPLNPTSLTPAPQTEPGLRGGRILRTEGGPTTLHQVRYVKDVQVSGTIRLNPKTATATLTTAPGNRLSLSWRPFRAENQTEVHGELDNEPFTVRIPTR
ncbi:alpha/beta fold hydrolase [Streptosporangium jomthongense]|uniref:Alpha/beta fold hydrolase n=1 Tax=Streptosporangium jomthongense TaxID=1193683 RepID=A0ABV8FC39_9ACTN